MRCSKCQYDNREEAQFCSECGHRFEVACSNCGGTIQAGSKFCDLCGHDLRKPQEALPIDYNQPQSYTPRFLADKILTNRSSIEGERKLVTVLFADVANYTSMAEKLDPEEVHQIMDGCFKILMDEIHRYEGTINQFTGDGVMALFGAPVAHEDHAQRACCAALAIQRALGKYSGDLGEKFGLDFKMRVGLNSGSVVVGSIGDDLRMDYTAIGDTTNLAARMESMARPSTILVTGHTRKLAKGFFEFEPLGKLRVKGKQEPVEAYQLLRTTEVETRIEAAAAKGLTEFVGREEETIALKKALNKARSGSGQVVGIVGEAGVGKSRLLIELWNMLPKEVYSYLEGRCLHYGRSMAYLPILDIIRSYFDIKEGDGEVIIKKKMVDKILQLDDRLKSTVSPLQELLSLKVEDDAYLRLEPQQKKLRTFEAIRDLLVRESENKPVVLVVEDLHWIDRTSEEFLSYLIDWLANAHILLILLYRPEYNHQWDSKSYYSKIGVDQLSTGDSAQLVQNILKDGQLILELRELILDRAGGNPLFVEELTHNLLENGSIQKKDHHYVLTTKASEIEVPDTIQGIIAARIDRVEESLKRIMQVASVIGREFAYRILQTIMGMREELKPNLLNLQRLEFIYENRLFPELEYIFKHALTQEVAYNSLLVKRRKEIHEKIAGAMESLYPDRLEKYYELLAYHYGRSGNTDKAVEYLDLTHQKAVMSNALAEAGAYFDEAMQFLDTMPETEGNRERRLALIVNQWLASWLLYKMREYHELLIHYEPLTDNLDNPGLLGAFFSRLGHCQWVLGYLDQSIRTEAKAAQLCEAGGNNEDAALAYIVWLWANYLKGDYDQVFPLAEKALERIGPESSLHYNMWAYTGPSWAYTCLGLWENALEEGRKALSLGEEYSDDGVISFAAMVISTAYTYKGELGPALEYAELSVQKAPFPAEKAWAQSALALAWCRAGEPQKGVELLEQIIPLYRVAPFVPGEVFNVAYLCEGYWLGGEYEKAQQALEELLILAERTGMRFYLGCGYRLLGEIAVKTNPSEAASHFEKSIALLREIKAENELALAYAAYGRFHKQEGDIAEAKEYLTNALEIFDRLGTLIEPGKVREELVGLPTS